MKLQALVAAMTVASSQAALAQVQLITPEEARLPNAAQVTTRGVTRGPGVKQMSPDPAAKGLKGPVDLKIAFEPRGGAKIDANSVTLTYMKTPPVDLTSRVKDSIKPEGIDVSKASLPPGDQRIRVSVKDSEGRQTNSTVSINVAN
ncbi:MAG: hypothetical protein FJY55_10505 [Betaproteobacteria bacterium]|nr:hypothetical protein [Betaproteobacteria bacterium]